jgi:hypothetical protein
MPKIAGIFTRDRIPNAGKILNFYARFPGPVADLHHKKHFTAAVNSSGNKGVYQDFVFAGSARSLKIFGKIPKKTYRGIILKME